MAIDLALVGLSLQVATLVIFSGLMVDYFVRFARLPEAREVLDRRMKTYIAALALAILLILARCSYRVDELSSGYSGPLIADEGLFIGLEGVLIIISTGLLCVGHPGFAFRTRWRKEELVGMEGTELVAVREAK